MVYCFSRWCSSRTVGGVTAALQVEGTAINDSSISMISNGASGTDGLPAKLVFGRTGNGLGYYCCCRW